MDYKIEVETLKHELINQLFRPMPEKYMKSYIKNSPMYYCTCPDVQNKIKRDRVKYKYYLRKNGLTQDFQNDQSLLIVEAVSKFNFNKSDEKINYEIWQNVVKYFFSKSDKKIEAYKHHLIGYIINYLNRIHDKYRLPLIKILGADGKQKVPVKLESLNKFPGDYEVYAEGESVTSPPNAVNSEFTKFAVGIIENLNNADFLSDEEKKTLRLCKNYIYVVSSGVNSGSQVIHKEKIAENLGISRQALNKRLNCIFKKLQKKFAQEVDKNKK
ncbi:MAG: hypothetical protein VB084_13545 [Syntrophomonadaceae bacterium]|nr:hypothetical protein [Syntrophomonadaceae bacterium]